MPKKPSLHEITLHLDHALDDIAEQPPDRWVEWVMYVVESLEAEVGTSRLLFLNDIIQAVNERMQDVPNL